ncbi:mechanosensitive ion channel family protein [Mesorhizobium sp.]|uniref:mechanosensitive ion channel family protein n=1 Tax=Mesorhizobium sp. TaxID=1871066 RepID=UPI000FE8FB98|nr:mechanosensitive ion channel family protein [Mesorhizobium sp.]RWK40066.1 MAG: mechanosensitive ion channel [Mesorhizobium sp.]RWK66898.1 MAG: mechanosensitive ion channel [Mesorhizobium sp.]RWK74016.1 MAG: mechanosensitive ion channel [Mesorhizobium sp.]RWK76674.1 MAG: mechanosensitive ion channel [Mesorhizobium sp.]RWL02331.1 MAG: mechanosensitive ion channel [Mesorhizobium sp.]
MDSDPATSWWNAPHLYMVLVGLAGIVVWHVIPRRLSTTRLIVQIAFFLTMSVLLLDGAVLPYEPTRGTETTASAILVGSAKLLWWVHLAWALIGFVRIYVVFERKPREARLLQDLVVGAVYVGMLLSILAFVFGAPVGTLIATSGVFAIVLGLALQNTLSDVFSGIALTLGRPYVLGDWIVLSDGTEGRVVETNWRSTHLLTLAHNVVALPNSFLAKLGLTNVSSPEESHGLSVTIRLAPTRMPAIVADVMNAALQSSNTILREPPPVVAIKALDATAIEVDLFFRVANVGQRIPATNEIFDLVYRHSKSAGLRLATPPSSSIVMNDLPNEETANLPEVTPIKLINAIPVFSALTDNEKEALAATVTVRTYRKGDIIARQGEMLPSLMIVRTGIIVRERGEDDAHPQEIGHLAPGDFFGETGLLAGIGETSTLRAMSHVVVYEIDQQSFAPLLLDRPEMAEDLAAVLSARMSLGDSRTGQEHTESKFALLKAMQTIFHPTPFRRVSSAGRPGLQEGRKP